MENDVVFEKPDDNDDFSDRYMVERTRRAEQSAGDRLRQKLQAKNQDAPGNISQTTYQPSERNLQSLITGQAGSDQSSPEQKGSAVGRVAADVATGIVETPRAIAHGIIDAANEVKDLGNELGNWISGHAGTIILGGDKLVEVLGPEEYRRRRALDKTYGDVGDIPNLAQPTSTTGHLMEGVSQFLAGFFGAGQIKAVQAIRPVSQAGQFGKAALQGAIADFSAFDPHEQRLSNLIESAPALKNPVTGYLQADPNDSAAEGRFKNALEGLGLGIVTEGFIRGVKLVRAAARAKVKAMDAERIAGGVDEIRRAVPDDAFMALGDPQGDLLTPRGTSEPVAPNVFDNGTVQTPAGRALQQRIQADPEGVRVEYDARPDSMGGKVLNTDVARELSPEYLADRTRSADVHEEASQYIKDLYAQKLKEAPKEGESNLVLFTAGGTGAGKTSSLQAMGDIRNRAQIIYDTNMSTYASAKQKIEQALAANKDVQIALVARDPIDALVNGALPRAERQAAKHGTGRTVPLGEHLKTHQGAEETVRRLAQEFANNDRVQVTVIDNSLGAGNAKIVPIEELPQRNYNTLADELNAALEKEYAEGRISEKTYQGFKGSGLSDSQKPGTRPADGAIHGGRTQPQNQSSAGQPAKIDLGVPDDVAARGITQPVEPETFINFARIESPDDVKNVMQQMADAFKSDIDVARRGAKRGFQQMELDAAHINAWETLQSRRIGEPLNAEQSLAARQLWVTSADKLTETAKKAAQSGSEADLFAFRKMMAIHQAIQTDVIAARTETARALASWRIPMGTGAERFMQVDNMLNMSGGAELSREMAERVSKLADAGMIQEMDAFVEQGIWAKSRDAMLEAWINGLLSGPKTHMVNGLSNTAVLFQQMYERRVAASIARFLGDEGSVALGEATAQYSGMINGFRDALRYAKKSFITGETGYGLQKVELPRQRAISSEALGISSEGLAGRTVDVLGTAINVPGRALGAADEFFKTIGYRMELNARALRQATQDVNQGLATDIKARMTQILQNPPDDLHLAGIDQAAYQTFTNTPGTLAKLITQAKGHYPGLNLILPFVRTPANIMTYTFERTPMAPLFQQFRANIAAGGTRRDLALSKMATGTAIMLVTADLAMNDQVTGKGPSNRAERAAMQRTGWQPYSVKLGDRYFAYNRMDPLGLTLGLAADMVEILANDDFGVEKQKNAEQVLIATAMSIANNAMSKTYLTGLSDLMEAMSDPERYGESFAQRLSGSIVPTGVAEIARGVDPYMREVGNMVDAMRKRTPGLSDDLPARRNLWGEKISYQSGLGVMYDAFSPIYSKAKRNSAIDDAILEHEWNINKPNARTSIDGVSVNLDHYPGAYSRFVELAGNEIKHPAWHLGAKDLLNEIVTGKHALSPVYDIKSDGPDGGKYLFVRNILEDYRNLAKDALLKEYPALQAEISERQAQKLRLRLPKMRQDVEESAQAVP